MSNTSATGGFLPVTQPAQNTTEDVLQSLIAGITGLPGSLVRPRFLLEPQKEPDVTVNWCALGIANALPQAYPELVHCSQASAGAGEAHVVTHASLNVLVSLYGPNCHALALALQCGLYVPQNRSILRPAGLAFVQAGAITQVPGLTSAGWRGRADLPLVFRQVQGASVAIRNITQSGGTFESETGITVGFGCGVKK